MSTTYKLSESESRSTGHGWNEQGLHIMIISVYIWAQLTGWVNPSHGPQDMVGMSKVCTLWSLACTYEHNLHSDWIQIIVHRAWLEWARFSHHDHQHVRTFKHNLQPEWNRVTTHRAWLEWVRFFTLWSSVCTYEHNLLAEKIRVTVHKAWFEWERFSHYDRQCVHEHNLQTEWIQVTVHKTQLEWANFYVMIISVYTSTTYILSESVLMSSIHKTWLECTRSS